LQDGNVDAFDLQQRSVKRSPKQAIPGTSYQEKNIRQQKQSADRQPVGA
jgi:hypothetical protein